MQGGRIGCRGASNRGCTFNNMLPTQATVSAAIEPPLGLTLPFRAIRAWDPKACCCWSRGQCLNVLKLNPSSSPLRPRSPWVLPGLPLKPGKVSPDLLQHPSVETPFTVGVLLPSALQTQAGFLTVSTAEKLSTRLWREAFLPR